MGNGIDDALLLGTLPPQFGSPNRDKIWSGEVMIMCSKARLSGCCKNSVSGVGERVGKKAKILAMGLFAKTDPISNVHSLIVVLFHISFLM